MVTFRLLLTRLEAQALPDISIHPIRRHSEMTAMRCHPKGAVPGKRPAVDLNSMAKRGRPNGRERDIIGSLEKDVDRFKVEVGHPCARDVALAGP